VRVLKLDGLLGSLYSPPDHDLPEHLTPEQIRKYPADHYDLVATKHRHTPRGELKPNPGILLKIIEGIGAKPEQCVYVGDTLMKDITTDRTGGYGDRLAALQRERALFGCFASSKRGYSAATAALANEVLRPCGWPSDAAARAESANASNRVENAADERAST
jgi:hypothetical protein